MNIYFLLRKCCRLSCSDASPFASSPRLFFSVSFPAVQSRSFLSTPFKSVRAKNSEEKEDKTSSTRGNMRVECYCPIHGKLVDFFFGFQTFRGKRRRRKKRGSLTAKKEKRRKKRRGSLTAVSTPIFASKASFFHVFRALHFFLCTVSEFCEFSIPLHRFFGSKPKKKSTNLPRISE